VRKVLESATGVNRAVIGGGRAVQSAPSLDGAVSAAVLPDW